MLMTRRVMQKHRTKELSSDFLVPRSHQRDGHELYLPPYRTRDGGG